MGELAYPVDHPKHPDNAGKKFPETRTSFGYDYAPNHPARGGQGQPVPHDGPDNVPHDGLKHLHGLQGDTLAKREKAFSALSKEEQAERLEWNTKGIPANPEEGE